jgi:hypothetical protein
MFAFNTNDFTTFKLETETYLSKPITCYINGYLSKLNFAIGYALNCFFTVKYFYIAYVNF